ncbi:MAG: GNAT family N-acetyltransferase [Thermodesulfovibrionales bacterium]|nr:GNAT family N-acetyltransferase [Thermodesulfovibrionales bacterium]
MKVLNYKTESILKDGERVTIRAITGDDKKRLLDGFRRLSPQSIKFRFLGLKKDLTNSELIYLTEVDQDKHVALVVTHLEDNKEVIIGVGRFIEVDSYNGVKSAEIALAVVDEHQNRGIGSTLFEHLKKIAIKKGIKRFLAHVLSDNCRMCELFKHHGKNYVCLRDHDMVRISCDIS